jgi:hypothetical protein
MMVTENGSFSDIALKRFSIDNRGENNLKQA